MDNLIIPLALLLDHALGEPRIYHPLVGFGHLASKLESFANDDKGLSKNRQKLNGMLSLALLLMPAFMLCWMIEATPFAEAAGLIGLYLAIGLKSLTEHARDIQHALIHQPIDSARLAISRIVSRDTQTLDKTEIASATVESVLENGSDALFAALFWFAVAGLKGVILYRLANTLDAMWGYKNERYIHFGWAAARFDDCLNFIPARLTALSYALSGHFSSAIDAWRNQAPQWKSPNAGPVMASGAGALGIELGGKAIYHGEISHRPKLGSGRKAEIQDIERAIRLVQRSLWVWLFFILLGEWII